MNKLILFLLGVFCSCIVEAQNKVEMADAMRSNGKIYVVVAVCLTILFGLIMYVYSVDRKITRIEKDK